MSDAAQTSDQTTTAPPPSTAPQAGADEAARWKAEAERAAQEREQWRELALSQQPQQQYQPAPQRAFSYPDQTTPSRPPASLALENPDEYDKRMDAYLAYQQQQTISQIASFAGPQLAGSGKFMSQSDAEYRDVWAKYGNEIEQEMVRNNIPPHARTKDAWDLLAQVVRGRHWRELADELANQRLQSGGFGTEGSGTVSGAPAANSDALLTFWNSSHPWVQRAKLNDMTLQQVREHIRKQGLTEQQWVDDQNKGRSFSAEAA